jgi:hypothetical protein
MKMAGTGATFPSTPGAQRVLEMPLVPQPVLSGRSNTVKLNKGTTFMFPARVYHGVEDLLKTLLNLSRFSGITPFEHITGSFVQGEKSYFRMWDESKQCLQPISIYTDIIKPNLVGDSYVRLFTYTRPIRCSGRWNNPLLKPYPFS